MPVTITKIPQLNSVVIKQKGVHFFIAAPDSFIIDKIGFLTLVRELVRMEFIDLKELDKIMEEEGWYSVST